MPRPPASGTPATEVLKVRLTPADRTALDKVRGTVSYSEYVRTLIRREVVKGEQKIQVETTKGVGEHRHRRGKLLGEFTVKGVTTKRYACAQTGCTEELSS